MYDTEQFAVYVAYNVNFAHHVKHGAVALQFVNHYDMTLHPIYHSLLSTSRQYSIPNCNIYVLPTTICRKPTESRLLYKQL